MKLNQNKIEDTGNGVTVNGVELSGKTITSERGVKVNDVKFQKNSIIDKSLASVPLLAYSFGVDFVSAREITVQPGYSGAQKMTFDGTYLWIARDTQSALTVYDPVNLTSVGTVSVGNRPMGMAFDGTYIWVPNYNDDSVSKVNASTLLVEATITTGIGTEPLHIAVDGSYVWVVNRGSNNVSIIDPSNDTVINTISVGTWPQYIVYDGTYMWVSNRSTDDVTKINASTQIIDTTVGFSGGDVPSPMAYYDGFVYVGCGNASTVKRINVNNNSVSSPVSVTTGTTDLAYDNNGFIWVVNPTNSFVTKIDVESFTVDSTFSTVTNARGACFDGTNMWICAASSANLNRYLARKL